MATETEASSGKGHRFDSLIYVQDLPTDSCWEENLKTMVNQICKCIDAVVYVVHPKDSKTTHKDYAYILMAHEDDANLVIRTGIQIAPLRFEYNSAPVREELYPLGLSTGYLKFPTKPSIENDKTLVFESRKGKGVEFPLDCNELKKAATELITSVLGKNATKSLVSSFSVVTAKGQIIVSFKYALDAMLIKALQQKPICTVRANGKPKYAQNNMVCYYKQIETATSSDDEDF